MNRNTGLAIVHIAAKEQGMDEERYRGFLEAHTGKRSAADFNPVEMRVVIREFEKRGFRVSARTPARKPSRGHPAREGSPIMSGGERADVYVRLIKRLWHQISRANNEALALRRRLFKYQSKTDLEQLTIEQLKEVYEDLQRASYCGARQW